MDLLERYLQAVKFWLPRTQKQDILAELSEDIRSEIQDLEDRQGRPLAQAELEAILTRWGHPMAVAERYLPQRALIGPVLLPAYTLVLKIVTLVYLVPWLLVGIGFVIFDPTQRTAGAIGDGLQSFWLIALQLIVIVTGIFAFVEWRRSRTRSSETWNAGELLEREPARDPHAIPRSTSIGELVTGLVFVWCWVDLLGSPSSYSFGDAIRITVWPLLPALYWSMLVFLAAGVAMSCLNLYRPWWTRRRAGARLAIDTLGFVVCLAIAAGPFAEIAAASPKAGVLGTVKWVNFAWYLTVGIVAVGCLARVIQDLRRMSGKRPIHNLVMTALGA